MMASRKIYPIAKKLFFIPLVVIFSCNDPISDLPFVPIDINELDNIYSPENVELIMRTVYNWQINHPVEENNGNGMAWARSAFYIGIMASYHTTQDTDYLNHVLAWATFKNWKLDKRYDIADDHAVGQVYLELYLQNNDLRRIQATINTFDRIMNEFKVGRELYSWADALFMSPPVLARLYAATGDVRYLNYLHSVWWDVVEYLYDREDHLFYNNKWKFNDRTPNRKKVFWSRGNGWVAAGLVRILQYVPQDDPFFNDYIDLFRDFSSAIVQVQQEDGFWRPSLADPEHIPFPETSGTAFFTYALAWGINQGYLDKKIYLPVVTKAWKALVESIHPNGMLGWVQPGGSQPDIVRYEDSQEYGTGALLLAGSEVAKLNLE